ncbi:MAG: methionine synthase [Candidatus Nitrosocaldaceae archaeon]|nr:MAG: methionine synthase [Candidatus Nitrosocaldaceae archaeon]
MKAFQTQEIGSLKKPRWLITALRDKEVSAIDKERARDDLAYLNTRILEDLGLDIVYDGEARRVEMYEYPIRHIEGFEFAGLVRSWDNKYYRKARCIGEVRYKENYHIDEFKFLKRIAKKELKIPITGPYTLADWSYNEYYNSKAEFIIALARNVIRPLMNDLVKHGAKIIQLDEPAATTHPAEMDIFVEAINECVKGIDAKVTMHICYSGNEYRALIPYLNEMNIKQYALEFANRDKLELGVDDNSRRGYQVIKEFKDNGFEGEIGLGVLDVHIDEIEPPELVRDRLLYVSRFIDPEKIYANPDCGLRTRSREIAFEKIRNMVKGADLARKELGYKD